MKSWSGISGAESTTKKYSDKNWINHKKYNQKNPGQCRWTRRAFDGMQMNDCVLRARAPWIQTNLETNSEFFPLLLRKTSSSEIFKDRYGTDPSIEYCVDIILSALELLPKTRFCQPWHWTSRTKNTYILGISISSGWLCPCREVFHFVTSKSNSTFASLLLVS